MWIPPKHILSCHKVIVLFSKSTIYTLSLFLLFLSQPSHFKLFSSMWSLSKKSTICHLFCEKLKKRVVIFQCSWSSNIFFIPPYIFFSLSRTHSPLPFSQILIFYFVFVVKYVNVNIFYFEPVYLLILFFSLQKQRNDDLWEIL